MIRQMLPSIRLLKTLASCLLICVPLVSVAEEEKKAEKKITFDDHIKPIFREHCTACHAEGDKASDLALDTYAGTLAGGSSGEVIAEGNTDGSRLYRMVAHTEQPYMPPDEDAISKDKIALIRTWIEQGMPENSGSKIKRSNSAAAAMLGSVSTGKPDGPPPMPEKLLKQPVIETRRSAAISAMAASPWAPLIALGGQEQVCFYHAETGELLGVIPFPEGEPQSLRFTRDGQQLLIGGGRHSHSGCAVLVDVKSGERITKVGDELDIVLAADISPDKRRIALAGPQKIVRVFDSATGDKVLEMKKHTDWIFSLRYSPDGILLASGDRSNGLIVWEAETGTLYADLVGHRGSIRDIDFRIDSNVLASASMDGTIKLWDMFESKLLKSWNAHGGGATALRFANNGSLASSGRDRRVKLWDGNGKVLKEFKGLADAALEVALTGDASFIAGGDWSGAAQVWAAADPQKGRPISANPPSIAKRVELAFAEVQKLSGLEQASKSAYEQENAKHQQAVSKLQEQTKQLQATQGQLAAATKRATELTAAVATTSQQIEQLKKQLDELEKNRQANQTELAAVTKNKQQLEQAVPKLTGAVSGSKASADALAKSVQAQSQKLQQATASLQLANKALATAKADQLAIEARAKALTGEADLKRTEAEKLAASLEKARQESVAKQARVEQAAAELNGLTEQLKVLQERLAQAKQRESAESQAAAEVAKTAADLKAKLEAAEQQALDARDKLELFKKSYKREPN